MAGNQQSSDERLAICGIGGPSRHLRSAGVPHPCYGVAGNGDAARRAALSGRYVELHVPRGSGALRLRCQVRLRSRLLRQIASWTGGGDEELLAYDARAAAGRRSFSTTKEPPRSCARPAAIRTTSPTEASTPTQASPNVRSHFGDRVHVARTVRSGGKTITSVDTCLRSAR